MTTTATTTSGLLRGTTENGVTVFRGILYAQPPVGPLRFAPPQPPAPWSGVREATAFGPTAMQAANAISDGLSVAAACAEDCLTLNVWTPAADAGRRPVLVWLHGGAFLTGAGSMPMYDGAALTRRGDVVVVTLNYRLGLFGYLRGIDVCGDALPSTGAEAICRLVGGGCDCLRAAVVARQFLPHRACRGLGLVPRRRRPILAGIHRPHVRLRLAPRHLPDDRPAPTAGGRAR